MIKKNKLEIKRDIKMAFEQDVMTQAELYGSPETGNRTLSTQHIDGSSKPFLGNDTPLADQKQTLKSMSQGIIIPDESPIHPDGAQPCMALVSEGIKQIATNPVTTEAIGAATAWVAESIRTTSHKSQSNESPISIPPARIYLRAKSLINDPKAGAHAQALLRDLELKEHAEAMIHKNGIHLSTRQKSH
jgi:hypothetical protein